MVRALAGVDRSSVSGLLRDLVPRLRIQWGLCPTCRYTHFFVFGPGEQCLWPLDEDVIGARGERDLAAMEAVRRLVGRST